MARRKSWDDFIKEVDLKAKKKKPLRTKVDIRGTLASKRNKRIAIREAALRGVTCVILYKKVTTGEIKRYEVIPISYRQRKLLVGWRKMLFAQDVRDSKQIKNFSIRNIVKAALTNRRIRPNWPVEIV